MANKAQGKGYENEANYANIQFQFIGIENIHVMRSSLQKLVEGFYYQFLLNLLELSCFDLSSCRGAWFSKRVVYRCS